MKRVTAQLSLMSDTKGPCSVRGRGFYTGGCALCPTGTHTVHCIYKQTTLQCHTSWSWTTIDTSTGAYFFIYLFTVWIGWKRQPEKCSNSRCARGLCQGKNSQWINTAINLSVRAHCNLHLFVHSNLTAVYLNAAVQTTPPLQQLR